MSANLGNGYHVGSGTSYASPQVAGVAALLRSVHPGWTAGQIKDRILATVDTLPSSVRTTVTGGRLNAAAAVATTAITISDPKVAEGSTGGGVDVVFTVSRSGDTSGSVTIDWDTSDDATSGGAQKWQPVFDSRPS